MSSDAPLTILKDPPSPKYWSGRAGVVAGTSDTSSASVRSSSLSQRLSQQRSQAFGNPRWYSTLNFVFSSTNSSGDGYTSGESGSGGVVPSVWVDNLSPEEQEQMLLQELLYILCGSEGSLITIQPVSPHGIRFIVDPRVEQSVRDLALQITQLAGYYYSVTHYVENYCDFRHGKVNQALCAAIRVILKEYFIMIAQLESFHVKGDLTLQKMWFFIHPTMQTFAVLKTVVTDIEDNKLRGGSVLTVLHEKATNMVADETLSNLCQSLAQKASEPYFAILESWIYRGMITDPFLEFLVVDNDDGTETVEKKDSDDYWEKRYHVEENKCPSFLRKMTTEILKAGKYLNVIRECGKDISSVSASQLHYSIHERVYVTAIESAYTFASKTLLDLLLKEYDLMRRLKSVKHYLLMDQGDFIVQFLDLAEDELNKQIDDLNPVRLESLLELALRTSSSSADPYKDNVRVHLFPFGIADQLWNIMAIETPLEHSAEDRTNFNIPGVEAFSFSYDVQWPISLVLNTRAITCYQLIFRQLFFCKHVERQLCKVWIANKSRKNPGLEKGSTITETFALCQKMLNFVQNLQYYVAFEVIEPAWHVFLATMNKVTNVDQVLTCHFDLLNSILTDSMLTSRSSLTMMSKLLSICLKFADKILSASDVRSHKNITTANLTIQDIAHQFNADLVEFLREVSSIVQDPNQSTKVANIIYRVNFNGFYTEALEKLSISRGD